MPITVKEIDARLKTALGIKNKERKIAYVMSLGQYIVMDLQMEQAEKGLAAFEAAAKQNLPPQP